MKGNGLRSVEEERAEDNGGWHDLQMADNEMHGWVRVAFVVSIALVSLVSLALIVLVLSAIYALVRWLLG